MLSRVASTSLRALPAQAKARWTVDRLSIANYSTSIPRPTTPSGSYYKLPPYSPVGVARALQVSDDLAAQSSSPAPTIFADEFSLADRVALVSGAHRGIGLEMALAFVEAGARAVYCVDLPKTPGEEWAKVREYAKALRGVGPGGKTGPGGEPEGRLEYISADVRDQEGMWRVGKTIGDREGRMDACVAAAGTLPNEEPCVTYSAEVFQQVFDVNVNGVLFTAQAAAQQMARFGNGGSIIMISSAGGHVAIKGHMLLSYSASKAAVLQMARSMASELGPQGIRVNSISPGGIRTSLMKEMLAEPGAEKALAGDHVLGRIGRPDELRGVGVWLASDASSFCTGSDFLVSGGY